MGVFLDANVLFTAAHNAVGHSRALFRLADAGLVSLICSAYAVDEAVRNVALRVPTCTAALASLLQRLQVVPEAGPDRVAEAAGTGLPAKDAPVLAAASLAGADMLVTGDRRHFGASCGKRPASVLILASADAVERPAADG